MKLHVPETVKHQPRDYQVETIQHAVHAYNVAPRTDEKRVLISLPTGTGKTFTAAGAALQIRRQAEERPVFLWVAHRDELISQACKEASAWGLRPNLWIANEKMVGDFTITSVQSAEGLPEALLSYARGRPIVIFVDEAHHITANSYVKLLRRVPHRMCVLLTATPTRLDGTDLGIDRILAQYTFLEMVKNGYLAQPIYHRFRTAIVINAKVQGGEFTPESMQDLNCPERNEMVVREILNGINGPYKRTLVFAVDVQHCKDLWEEFNRQGYDYARFVHGKHDMNFRRAVVDWFNRADDGVLINAQIFEEGFDAPRTTAVCLARPTASESRYLQWIGRGARVLEDKKEFYILDFVDQIDKYALLAERWSVENLGAPPDEVLEEERQDEEEREFRMSCLKEELEEVGENFPKKLIKEFPKICGVMTVTSKRGLKRMAVTSAQLRVVNNLHQHLLRARDLEDPDKIGMAFKDRVEDREFHTAMNPNGEFGIRTWKSVCWALYYRYVRHWPSIDGTPTLDYISIDDLAEKRRVDTAESAS